MKNTDKWIAHGVEFDPTKKYGVIGPISLSIEEYELHARIFLPKGTPFKILENKKRGERAWFYSKDGEVPNLDRVKVIKECIA